MLNFKLPKKTEVNLVISSFSKKERIIFAVLTIILFMSTISILESINKSFMVGVPLSGGSVSLGIVGTPRFINPVLANSLADQSLVSLIYSGLMRKSTNGTLIPDLAEKYEKSKDGLSYTFSLKNNIYFQNGKPITADDVVFTVNKIKDLIIKSPQKVNWEGVSVVKIDEKNIKFTLQQPYASFLENATIGIMPRSLWEDSPIELNTANTNPIGSGPYEIDSAKKKPSGVIDSFELVPFQKFILGKPYIQNMNLHFFPNEDEMIVALKNKTINQTSSLTPENAESLEIKGYKIHSSVLPRIFGLFFNQNTNNLFVNKTIVRAIDQAIDKEKIVREVLLGHGIVINNPIPQNIITYQKINSIENMPRPDILKKVQNDLAKDGWKVGADGFLEKTKKEKKGTTTTKLEFSISTSNATELAKTAELIKQDLAEVGIKVEVKTFETGNLNQSVIRPRKYDALLFGEIINRESDLFAFWHSSQRKDPGLNVAMYTNAKVDKILEEAFVTINDDERTKKYIQFENEISKDMPAVFLYSPKFISVIPENLNNFFINRINSPADLYQNAYLWYKNTENVWRFFAK